MKRIVGVAVWLVVLVGVMSWPVVAYNWSLASDGVRGHHDHPLPRGLRRRRERRPDVTETLNVYFPVYGKHGIFRFFDLADPSATGRAGCRTTSR